LNKEPCVNTCKFIAASILAVALHLSPALAQDVSFGSRLFHEKADCPFCHGPDGDGRGDPHSTPLTKREIEAVADYIIKTFVGK
jgi:hypothetical protein